MPDFIPAKGPSMLGITHLRQLYDYHFTLNHRVWNHSVMALTDDQYLQPAAYSVGSVRNQMVHMMNIEDRWFSGLRGVEIPWVIDVESYDTRARLRPVWDQVEANIQGYLDQLTDDDLTRDYDDGTFQIWQILLHVINHGTDHRAQSFVLLNNLGAPTFPQDYAFVVMGIDTTQPPKR
jgi:uncharacterized damage-inducible protein DinB